MLGITTWTLGNIEDGERLSRQALELSYSRGPRFYYDAAEALWNGAPMRGPSKGELADELLVLGQRTGHPRILAGGLILAGENESDTGRAIELLAEARELTARTGDTWRHFVGTLWLSVLQAIDDPRAVVEAIRLIIDQVRTTGQHIALPLAGRSLISPLVRVGLFDCAPLLDGVSSEYTLQPERAIDAVRRARNRLGDQEYDRRKDEAATRPIVDIEEDLLQAYADLPA